MRTSLIAAATHVFRETPADPVQPEQTVRWLAYIEAIGACGLLAIVGLSLTAS